MRIDTSALSPAITSILRIGDFLRFPRLQNEPSTPGVEQVDDHLKIESSMLRIPVERSVSSRKANGKMSTGVIRCPRRQASGTNCRHGEQASKAATKIQNHIKTSHSSKSASNERIEVLEVVSQARSPTQQSPKPQRSLGGHLSSGRKRSDHGALPRWKFIRDVDVNNVSLSNGELRWRLEHTCLFRRRVHAGRAKRDHHPLGEQNPLKQGGITSGGID